MKYSHVNALASIDRGMQKLTAWNSTCRESALSQELEPKNKAVLLETIGSVNEFFKVTLEHVQTLRNTLEMLERLRTDPSTADLGNEESFMYDQYMKHIKEVILAFQELNLTEDTLTPSVSPEEALVALKNKILSPEFTKLTEAEIKLIHSKKSMEGMYLPRKASWDQISRKISQEVGFSNFFDIRAPLTSPHQYITRLPLMTKEIDKNFKKLHKLEHAEDLEQADDLGTAVSTQLFDRAQEFANDVNRREAVLEDMVDIPAHVIEQLRSPGRSGSVALCQEILKINAHNPVTGDYKTRGEYFPTYLTQLLIIGSTANSIDLTSLEGQQALGVDPDSSEQMYDPKNFNPAMLQKLFEKDHNPIWLVLKSTIPVSEHFSPSQKIIAYINLAAQYSAKQFGETGKYLGAYEMAKAAIAVAKEYPGKETDYLIDFAFSPFQTKATIGDQLQNGQFGNWIVAKTEKKQRPEVLQSLSNSFKAKAKFEAATGGRVNDDISPADSGYAEGEPVFQLDEAGSSETDDPLPQPPTISRSSSSSSGLFKPQARAQEHIFQRKELLELEHSLNHCYKESQVDEVITKFKEDPNYKMLEKSCGSARLEHAVKELQSAAETRVTTRPYCGPTSV